MKRIGLLILLISISISSYSQDKRRGTLFNNDKLLIEKMEKSPSWTRFERSWQYVAFDNKTNYTLRVNFEVSVRFIRYHDTPIDYTKKKTIIIKPQKSDFFFPEDYGDSNWVDDSNIIITDFTLIDYSIKKEDYEVPW